ncbi:phage tail protein [Paenibacillus sp. FSL K6-1330]|uniref:phage tail sheath family protein n=1 Tax=Paenibacillus sp. FSL K6-1330 TaxID=2975292 RepID=UPI0030D713D8
MFKHGVYVNEKGQAPVSRNQESTIPVVFVTAPKGAINTPVMAKSFTQAAQEFGYSEDFSSFTVFEFIDAYFNLYGQSQAIIVNVLDPATAKKNNTTTVDLSQDTTVTDIQYPVLDSVKIKKGTADLVKGTDYTAELDDDGYLVISIPSGSSVTLPAAGLTLTYDAVDPSKIKNADLIGKVDAAMGKRTGFELLDSIIPMFGLVPGLVLAPKYSTDTAVAAAMTSKAQRINSMFKAFALTDLDTSTFKTKKAAIDAKKAGAPGQDICWPKVTYKNKQYHMSTHKAGLIVQMDAANNGIPSISPSNRSLIADGCVLADGTPVFIGMDEANELNGAGISTMLAFIGGPRAWGNRTAAYPDGATEMKDVFISAKRMMFWINNRIVIDTWEDVDSNITKRFVESVTDKHNLKLNGLVSMGALLGGRCTFNPADNPDAQLIDGKIKFAVAVGLAPVAETMEFTVEVDTSYLSTITAG